MIPVCLLASAGVIFQAGMLFSLWPYKIRTRKYSLFLPRRIIAAIARISVCRILAEDEWTPLNHVGRVQL